MLNECDIEYNTRNDSDKKDIVNDIYNEINEILNSNMDNDTILIELKNTRLSKQLQTNIYADIVFIAIVL